MVYGQILGLLLVVKLQTLSYTWGQSIPESPCPDVFQYQVNSNGMWYALISVPTPEPDFNVKLNVELSIDAILPTRYAGKLQLLENKNEVWRRIITGDKRPVQYELYFPLSWPLPIVRQVTSNRKVLCTGNPPNTMMTKLSLEHTLYPIRLPLGQNSNQNQDNPVPPDTGVEHTTKLIPFHPISPPVTPAPPEPVYTKETPKPPIHIFTRPPTTLRTTSTTQPPNQVHECGVSFKSPVQLVVNGTPTERGEWPWLVAMYIKSALPGLQFQCGGSLLSPTVVLTAAHCIKYKGRPTVKAEAIILYMGKYNLQQWTEKDNQPRDVEQVYVHPDYSEEGFEADLAVLVLKSKVDFTIYVQPICLWDFSSEINLVVGQIGTVVGWGKDENRSISSEPRKTTMPIVSLEQCLLSKKEFVFYTSNRTFCAGALDGSGPCSGDSGGGFMLSYPEGGQVKWYLRGVVHLSLYDRESQQCDLQNYLIYTDVAKFMDWIREYVPY